MNPRSILLTAYDETMAPIGNLTAPLMLAYANRHGMDFLCCRQFTKGRAPYWEKVDLVLRALQNYDRAIWLDADQMVTNPEVEIQWPHAFAASLDWGTDAETDRHFSACGFAVTQNGRELFEWLRQHQAAYYDRDFPEQTAMRESQFHQVSTRARRVFNAVPIELCPTAPEPWQPGDFACHLTHVEVPLRVAMFHTIQERLHARPDTDPADLLTSAPYSNEPSAHLPGE